MPTAKTTYESTKQEVKPFEQLIPTKTYNPSQEESDIIKGVLWRFNDMKSARSMISKDWMTWQTIIEAKYMPYADGRTRVKVPIFRSLQELFVAEASARKIQKEINPVGMSDVDKVEIMKEVWDYEWNKNRRDEQMTDAEYACSAWGTCAYFTGFEQSERVINDPSVGDDLKISYTKKLMRKGRIILRTLDIRNVYFDDRSGDFDEHNDQIFIEWITPEQFRQEMNDPNLINQDTVGTTSKTEQDFWTMEDRGRLNTGLVEKLHYWNKQADKYVILYNRSIVGRNDPIPYAHKELPIVPRQYGKIMNSVYGRGLAEACFQFQEKYNKLSEMLFDGISRSNNSIFAMGNGLTFDGNKFSFNNQTIKFNGQLNDANFREIKGIAPNQAAFTYLQDLLREIAIFIGIDISQVVGQASSTAFETAQKVESGLKRVNVALINRDYSLAKVFPRHLANIMQFFPVTEAESIVEIDSKGKTTQWEKKGYPKILLDGKQFVKETGKLVERPWKFDFECDPEYIRGQFDIVISTNYNTPTLKSLKQESMKNFLNAYAQYSQISLADPNIAKIIKPDDFIKELAFTYDIDISSIGGFEDSYAKQWDELMSKVNEMGGIQPQVPQGAGMPQPQPQWQPQSASSTGIPLTPNIPWNMPSVSTPPIPTINSFSSAQKSMM